MQNTVKIVLFCIYNKQISLNLFLYFFKVTFNKSKDENVSCESSVEVILTAEFQILMKLIWVQMSDCDWCSSVRGTFRGFYSEGSGVSCVDVSAGRLRTDTFVRDVYVDCSLTEGGSELKKTVCFYRIYTFNLSFKVKIECSLNGVSACEEEVLSVAAQRKLPVQEAPQTNIQ